MNLLLALKQLQPAVELITPDFAEGKEQFFIIFNLPNNLDLTISINYNDTDTFKAIIVDKVGIRSSMKTVAEARKSPDISYLSVNFEDINREVKSHAVNASS